MTVAGVAVPEAAPSDVTYTALSLSLSFSLCWHILRELAHSIEVTHSQEKIQHTSRPFALTGVKTRLRLLKKYRR